MKHVAGLLALLLALTSSHAFAQERPSQALDHERLLRMEMKWLQREARSAHVDDAVETEAAIRVEINAVRHQLDQLRTSCGIPMGGHAGPYFLPSQCEEFKRASAPSNPERLSKSPSTEEPVGHCGITPDGAGYTGVVTAY
jgi:hypothetical protein